MITGNMQHDEFNVVKVLQYAARWHGDVEVVTNTVEGGIHRINYRDIYSRTKKLANALDSLGVQSNDCVATMAWNTWRHLECWYAIGGMGAITHTLNPRLFPDQIDFIVNHAQDKFIFVDISFVPVLASVMDKLTSVKGLVVMTDAEHMPDVSSFKIPVHCYEDLIAEQSDEYTWSEFDENQASSLCYTSGTTGNPKGVLYSHRSNLIHAMSSIQESGLNVGINDTMLMIVPMFHANSWGLAFSVPMVGAKLVMAGPHMDGASVHTLIDQEQCTKSAAVPTVWTGLLDYLDDNNLKVDSLKETTIGGSAVPRSMIEKFDKEYGVDVIHAWGMTETSPVGTINRAMPFMKGLSDKELLDIKCKQGRVVFGIDMKIVDEQGNELEHNGEAVGPLLVKGPWVVQRYYKQEESAVDENGWFDTGDVASIDKYGMMLITDRSKDIIKSGGEWISSVDLENAAIGHPELQMAACIGIKHKKWEERPLLIAVKKQGCDPSKESIIDLLGQSFAKWQLPDDVVFVDEIPLTATGKIDKKPLREEFMEYYVK